MLHHRKSKSSNRLSRRKSTTSTNTKSESMNSEVARQQAQAAAVYAFVRAQERNSTDIGRSDALARNNSIASWQSYQGSALQGNDIGDGDRVLKRQQSVRFTGPTAVRRRQSFGTRPTQNNITRNSNVSTLQARVLATDAPEPAKYRPHSRSPTVGKTSISKNKAEDVVSALASFDEYYTREDDIASTPSSYRRLKKSKSFSSQIKFPSINFNNGTPDTDSYNRGLKAPKSMSFLRGGREHTERQDLDVAVQVARDKFLHQIEQQRLREQPSFLFRPRARREEKPFRTTVRRSRSSSSYGMPISSNNQNVSSTKDGSMRAKARKVSRSLKDKLKGLFRKVSNTEENEPIVIPNQQVESHNENSVKEITAILYPDIVDIPHPDSATLSRVASRQPSLHSMPSLQQLRSRTGSVQSMRSDGSSKSRVTSWTSTAQDTTVNSRHAQAERERQRLSIIQENGTHIPSSSFRRPHLRNQFSAYPIIQMPKDFRPHQTAIPGVVDSHRVYSALMKRLEENSPTAKLAQRRSSVESFRTPVLIPPRSSSRSSKDSARGNGTPATIRHVFETPKTACEASNSYNHPDRGLDDVFSIQDSLTIKHEETVQRGNRNISNTTVVTCRKSDHDLHKQSAIEPTPQQLALRNEPVLPPAKGLREIRSTFFGTSSVTKLPGTTSPYRRALAEADYNPAVIKGEQSVGYSPARTTTVVSPRDPSDTIGSTNSSHRRNNRTYTESIYSRSTSGRTPVATSSSGSSPIIKDSASTGILGSMTLVDQITYQPSMTAHRKIPSSGSTEWKSWMSAQVSTLERSKNGNNTVDVHRASPSILRTSGHVREDPQITDDDTDIGGIKVSMPKQPLGVLQQNMHSRPILKARSSFSSRDISIPPPPPPPMPVRSPLHPVMSQSSLRSVRTMNTENATNVSLPVTKTKVKNNPQLLHTRSDSMLPSMNTPARPMVRNGRSINYTPSPGLGAAVDKQFGSLSSRSPHAGRENYVPTNMVRDNQYYVDGTGLMEPQPGAEAMGSRRMVDMFLSSRRRRMAGSDESNAFI